MEGLHDLGSADTGSHFGQSGNTCAGRMGIKVTHLDRETRPARRRERLDLSWP